MWGVGFRVYLRLPQVRTGLVPGALGFPGPFIGIRILERWYLSGNMEIVRGFLGSFRRAF